MQQRHNDVRKFQEEEPVAKLLVATIKTGSVGLTLTAATRVFLMEPCIEPQHEVQAAGRIHRLGQSRDVFVKRYAFRGTIDESILEFHEKIKQGDLAVSDGKIPREAMKLLWKR